MARAEPDRLTHFSPDGRMRRERFVGRCLEVGPRLVAARDHESSERVPT